MTREPHGSNDYEALKKALRVPGVSIGHSPMSQYGGQESWDVRRDGMFYYYIPREFRHRLETDGLIDATGATTAKGRGE